MRKLITILALAAVTMAASAQERGFYGNKFTDNWYVGAGFSLDSKTTHQALFKGANPGLTLKVGKLFSPIIGAGVEGTILTSSNPMKDYWLKSWGSDVGKTKYWQVGIFANVNLTNAIKGYYGEPRWFEVQPMLGFYWGHNSSAVDGGLGTIKNTLVNKFGIDFMFNLGKAKMFQIFLEPSINWAIAGAEGSKVDEAGVGNEIVLWNINNSFLGLNIGLNYKFLTSNGSHNFMVVEACDQTEMDELNNAVTELRKKTGDNEEELANLKRENERLQKALKECQDKPAQVVKEYDTPDLPAVFYEVNKAVITPAQTMNVAIAAEVLKKHPEYSLEIKGYASPEGEHENNNSLGVRRANAVKDMLVKKYKIAANRITTEGCGETDKLFPIFELNRVAIVNLVKAKK